jgi:hypothetical protein
VIFFHTFHLLDLNAIYFKNQKITVDLIHHKFVCLYGFFTTQQRNMAISANSFKTKNNFIKTQKCVRTILVIESDCFLNVRYYST